MGGNVTSQRPCLLKHSERVVSKPTLNDQINIDQVNFCQNAKTRFSFKNVQIHCSVSVQGVSGTTKVRTVGVRTVRPVRKFSKFLVFGLFGVRAVRSK